MGNFRLDDDLSAPTSDRAADASTEPRPQSMSRFRGWLRLLAASGLIVVLSLVVIRQSQPKTIVGRHWNLADRIPLNQIRHSTWTALLRQYVDVNGNVDYANWSRSSADRLRLEEYLEHLSRANPDLPAEQGELLSFWINAYNALSIHGILAEYPTSSIQNHVSNMWGYNIWRDLCLRVNGHDYSLGQIEHEQLRPMKEPQIHFAIVCSSRGCPRLMNEAYEAEQLSEQLRQNAKQFFADPSKCRFDASKGELQLSPILRWYAKDFGETPAAQLKTIADWLPDDQARTSAKTGQLTTTDLDYDWSLNERIEELPTDAPPLPPQ